MAMLVITRWYIYILIHTHIDHKMVIMGYPSNFINQRHLTLVISRAGVAGVAALSG